MYLDHIKIKNFRIFENFDLKLNPGLNVLVGENDSGKTALIDAIRYVLGTNSAERTYVNESDFHNDSRELSIQLKFVNVDKHAHVFVEHLTHEKNGDNRTSVLYVQLNASITDLEKRGYPYIRREKKSGKDGNGLILESEILDFLSTTYLKPLRDVEGELSSGRGSRLSQVLNSSKDIKNDKDKILGPVAKANSILVGEESPVRKTSNLIEQNYLYKLIFKADQDRLKANIDIAGVKDISGLNDNIKKKYLRPILERLSLSLTEESHKHGLGYNNLLFIALELLLLEQERENEFPLLLIEEPEAHLHPQLQMKLLDFINAEAKKDMQCILSTHSPNISSKAKTEEIILLNEGKAFSLRAEETELDDDSYKFIDKFLDVTKANLFFARGVILVEGDAENILIPTIAKLLGKPLEDYGISIINIGNTGWKHFAKLLLRRNNDECLPIKVAVLRDLDLWPLCAEDNNKYGFKTNKPVKENGKGGNQQYWLKNNEDEKKKQVANKKEALKKEDKNNLERQNIKVCISDHWTFEYCLSFFGLFDECYEAIHSSDEGKNDIVGTDEEKATYILGEIEKKKTDFSSKMALLLETKYKDNPDGLRKNLPPYIIDAIEFVTTKIENKKEKDGDDNVSA